MGACVPTSEKSAVLQCALRMLRCVVLCCSVLQCVAVRCSELQCVAVCCSMCESTWAAEGRSGRLGLDVCCSVLQRVAVRCSALQCVAVCVILLALRRAEADAADLALM